MWHRHAVWCQCALTMPAIITLASAMSVQGLTWDIDMYWTLLLGANTFVQFVAAEHGKLKWGPEIWQRVDAQRHVVLSAALLLWYCTHWPVYVHMLADSFFVIASIQVWAWGLEISCAVATIVTICVNLWTPLPAYCACLYLTNMYFEQSIQTSSAGIPIRMAYGAKAARILLETVLIWSVRCTHRFPHTIRWTPIMVGILAIALAGLWCMNRVKPTKVSRNAVIVSKGHGLAASLQAAYECPVCQSCLTSLDMEASFGE